MPVQAIHSLTLLLLFASASLGYAQSGELVDEISSKAASKWFELLYGVVKAEKTLPPPAARAYGVASVALYEAVVDGTRENRSLAGQLNGLTSLPKAAKDVSYHWPTVANTALANTVRGVYPSVSPNTLGKINSLERKLDAEYRAQIKPDEYERSAAHGRAVSGAILAWAATDGFAAHNNCAYLAPQSLIERWRPTPPSFSQLPLQPCWGQLRPMALRSGRECAAPGPPKYSSNTNSDFHGAAVEVYKVGLSLTNEQKIISDYWADNPGATGTPPGHWIAIVSQIARRDGLSLAGAAEAYARVGIAVHDAFIGCWYTKYAHNLKRPVTYINENVHGQWRSYVITPGFPTYPSGHSAQSGAATHVLTDLFGKKSFQDTTHVDHGVIPAHKPRHFKSFRDAAAEAAISRLYGGIHYAFDNNDGLGSGECIGRTILERVKFRRGP